MLIGRMQKEMDTQRNVDDTIVIIVPFLSNGLCLDVWLKPVPRGPQNVVFRACFRTEPKCCQPPTLPSAWQKAKPAVWNILGFDTRELQQVLEAWAGLKEDIDLPSWCSAGEQQAMEGGSGTVPSLVTALPCLHGSVRLWWFTCFLLFLWGQPKLLTWDSVGHCRGHLRCLLCWGLRHILLLMGHICKNYLAVCFLKVGSQKVLNFANFHVL